MRKALILSGLLGLVLGLNTLVSANDNAHRRSDAEKRHPRPSQEHRRDSEVHRGDGRGYGYHHDYRHQRYHRNYRYYRPYYHSYHPYSYYDYDRCGPFRVWIPEHWEYDSDPDVQDDFLVPGQCAPRTYFRLRVWNW